MQPRVRRLQVSEESRGPDSCVSADEREYRQLKENMYLDEKGTEEYPGPHWVAHLPWKINKELLTDNKPAVMAVLWSTLRRLEENPVWQEAYEAQIKELITEPQHGPRCILVHTIMTRIRIWKCLE